jgi:hypothetical protein
MKSRSSGLRLVDFEPKSMLKVRETRVERPRFPVIDFHTHLSMSPDFGDPAPGGGEPSIRTTPERALSIMEGVGVRTLVNVTGGCGSWDGSRGRHEDFSSDIRTGSFSQRMQSLTRPTFPSRRSAKISTGSISGSWRRRMNILTTRQPASRRRAGGAYPASACPSRY